MEPVDYGPLVGSESLQTQDLDLWGIVDPLVVPVRDVIGAKSLPGTPNPALAQPFDRSGTCQWVALDGAVGLADAWLFLDGRTVRMAHGVSVWVGDVKQLKILPLSHDRTSFARLIWTPEPIRLPRPASRSLSYFLTAAASALFDPDGSVLSISLPRGATTSRIYAVTAGAIGGVIQVNHLYDDGVTVDLTIPFVTLNPAGTGTREVFVLTTTGNETFAIASDRDVQLRIVWGLDP